MPETETVFFADDDGTAPLLEWLDEQVGIPTRNKPMANRTNALKILRNRYVKNDPKRKASVATERLNSEIARLLYDMRTEAGLTQKQLAELVGTTQSVISRLEDSDYDGHSLTMLNRIAEALHKKLSVVMS